jgi:hypothetical protein
MPPRACAASTTPSPEPGARARLRARTGRTRRVLLHDSNFLVPSASAHMVPHHVAHKATEVHLALLKVRAPPPRTVLTRWRQASAQPRRRRHPSPAQRSARVVGAHARRGGVGADSATAQCAGGWLMHAPRRCAGLGALIVPYYKGRRTTVFVLIYYIMKGK